MSEAISKPLPHHSEQKPENINQSSSADPAPLRLQDHHRVFTVQEMLDIYRLLNEAQQLKNPDFITAENKNQPWFAGAPQVPVSLQERQSPPTPPGPAHNGMSFADTEATLMAFSSLQGIPPRTRSTDSPARLFEEPFGRTGSPAISRSSFNAQDLTSSGTMGSPRWGIVPPGLQSRVIAPENIQWVYTDPNGMLQGPFNGTAMNGWFMSGWLKDDLCIKRPQDSDFVAIGSIKQRLQTENPFSFRGTQEQWDQVFQPRASAHGSFSTWNVWGGTPSRAGSVTNLSQSFGSQTSLNQGFAASQKFSSSFTQPSVGMPARRSSTQATQEDFNQTEEREFSGLLSQLDLDDADALPDNHVAEPEPIAPIAAPSRQAEEHSTQAPPAPIAAPIAAPEPIAPEPVQVHHQEPQIESPTPTEPIAVPESTSEPALAPWANRTNTPKAYSLAEIQAREAAKKKQEAEKHRQSLLATQALRATETPQYSKHAPSAISSAVPGLAWGTPQLAGPKRSVADIQREQQIAHKNAQQQKAAFAPSTKPVAPAWGAANVSEVTKPSSSHSGQSFAAAVQPGPSNGGGWQTVGRNKKPHLGAGSAPAVSSQAKGFARQPSSSEMKPASRSDELIQWCKISFKQGIAKDVNHDELLSLFLSLPATNDGREFIAESIYSYSTTMDGRRFASDFMQRRRDAETTFKPGETWASILQKSNPDTDLDPSFKVVTKKRFRQIAKPNIN